VLKAESKLVYMQIEKSIKRCFVLHVVQGLAAKMIDFVKVKDAGII
jgi:hypothetical protein